jgi:hypothetical protein
MFPRIGEDIRKCAIGWQGGLQAGLEQPSRAVGDGNLNLHQAPGWNYTLPSECYRAAAFQPPVQKKRFSWEQFAVFAHPTRVNAFDKSWSPPRKGTCRRLVVSRWLETRFELGISHLRAQKAAIGRKSDRLPGHWRAEFGRFEVSDPRLFSGEILLTDSQRANIHAGRARLKILTHFFAGQEPCGQVSSVSFSFGFDEPARRRNPLWFS